jgi:CheY-like chemotaxis protein
MHQNKPKIVLLIDDNEIDQEINKKLLLKSGNVDEVETKSSVQDGLNYLTNTKASGKYPDLILLDIYMPDMNGFQFLEHFQEFPDTLIKHCPVLMVSSSRDELDLNRAKAHPLISDVLKKPLDINQVALYLG